MIRGSEGRPIAAAVLATRRHASRRAGRMSIHRILSCALVCAVVTACSADKGEGESGAGTTGTATTGAVTTGADESATDVAVTTGGPSSCDLPDVEDGVCGAVEVTCDGVQALVDEAALACTLAAMRDRTPGRVSLSRCENAGQNSYHYVWTLRAEGTARRTLDGTFDFCSVTGEDLLIQLAPPAYFTGCLDKADWQSRVACLTNSDNGVLVETCDPGVDECHEGV